MNLGIKATGVDKIAGKMDLIAGRAHDASSVFSDIVDDLIDAEGKLFRTGRGWPQDKPGTLRQKKAKGQDLRPLRATGAAEQALTDRDAPGQVLKITRDSLEFGIDSHGPLFYMRFQKRYGRDPLVSRGVIRRASMPHLQRYFRGE